jgi:molecular chaperone DnaK (HSP70)
MTVLIAQNSTIPAKKSQVFTMYSDNHPAVTVKGRRTQNPDQRVVALVKVGLVRRRVEPFEFIEIRQNCECLSLLFAFEGPSASPTKPNSDIIQNRPIHRQMAEASHASQKVARINNAHLTINKDPSSTKNQQ